MAAADPLPPLPPVGGEPAGRTAGGAGPPDPALSGAAVASFAAALAEAELAILAAEAQNEGGFGTGGMPLLGLLFAPASALGSAAVPFAQQPAGGAAPLGGTAPVGGVVGVAGSEPVGERIVRIAESQVGQHEEPPGSEEGVAIARYRSATRGAIPGAPWCAYFVSWVAKEAGVPLGNEGQGFGAVSEIWHWAQETHRAIPNGPGVVPKPGDLIVFGDQHVGIVRRVLPDGMIETVEGNYEDKVALNVRSPSEPTGYVEL
jgi:hypothetical protein